MKKFQLIFVTVLTLGFSTALSLPNFWYSAVAYNSTGQIITTSPLASVQVTVTDGTRSMTQTFPNVPVDGFGVFNIYVNGAGLGSVNLVARTQIMIKVNGIIVAGAPLTSTLTVYDYLGYLRWPTGIVNVGSIADPQQFVVVKGTSVLNGQTTVIATVSGGDGSYDAYPFRVEGSDQGIAIKVNGSRSNANNFVTFWDNDGVQGRIEGETIPELTSDPGYKSDISGLNTSIAISSIAMGVAIAEEIQAIIELGNYFWGWNLCGGFMTTVCPPVPSESIPRIAAVILKTANIVAASLSLDSDLDAKEDYKKYRKDNIGVTFVSGAGDYAEWLPKANPQYAFQPGDVVGIRGGRISPLTENADKVMVVSKKPIVLGNMPEAGKENEYEKIAFMGQVSVKVRGKIKEGDYILPSGYQDGYGIGVSPENMEIEDYQKIVGIAWSSTSSTKSDIVNVAVGLNANDIAKYTMKLENKIDFQAKEIEDFKERLNKIEELLANFNTGSVETKLKTNNMAPKVENNNQAGINNQIVSNNQKNHSSNIQQERTYFRPTEDQIKETIAYTEELLRMKGVDVDKHPFFKKLKEDPQYKKQFINKTIGEVALDIDRKIKLDAKNGIKSFVQ